VCGIAGIKLFNKKTSKSDEDALLKALERQKHRGPDNTNILSQEKIILGHNRLSIIDTNNRSNQPFKDSFGRFSIVFNGEIYNYQELKNDLISSGKTFKTSSDTEVLFLLLIEEGKNCLEKLRGCFSFAFYDSEEDYLLLARDRMGINPLLYSIDKEKLVFGSELSIFDEILEEKNISDKALNQYFQYTYISAPKTIYQEVKKLLPGNYLELRKDEISLNSYWSPRSESSYPGTFDQAKKELREKLEFAVISQLEADVPIGTFLSGGVDSSLISAIASTIKDDLHTFSVSFGEDEKYDESKYAFEVAKHIKSKHHVIRLTEKEFVANFQAILDSFDEPFADSSAIAMWFLAQETSKHLKVALSGDGADELFAGYNKHKAFQKSIKTHKAKSSGLAAANSILKPILQKIDPKKAHKISKFVELNKLSWPQNYLFLASNIGEKSKNNLLIHQTNESPIFDFKEESLNEFLLLDQQLILPNDMLKKVDLMSMRHSLEVRTPFMDKDLVKFANSLPSDWKLNNSTGKYILREATKDLLPSSIFTRKKQGFEVPTHAWIKNNWEDLIPGLWFDKEFLKNQHIFHFEAVLQLKTQFFSNIGTSNHEMWAYLVFQNWFKTHIKDA
jgi:asparagine synthase (glutamine-hydrolysing)